MCWADCAVRARTGGLGHARDGAYLEKESWRGVRLELTGDRRMSAYRWNTGGDYRGQQWTEDHPTDAQVRR
jgi:hypothetical protein